MLSIEINKLAGSDLCYVYRELEKIQDKCIEGHISRTRKKFAPIAKSFDDSSNVAWFVRAYLALKYILAATVFGTSAQHARNQNLQITLPYLYYYMMLHCCRSFIFSLPDYEWEEEESIEMNHNKIINIAVDKLSGINKELGEKFEQKIKEAKFHRELFSYRFPARGISSTRFSLDELESSINTARLFVDLAQLNFTCLVASIEKHGNASYELDFDEVARHTMEYQSKMSPKDYVFDDDDYHRVGYFMRKMDTPWGLNSLATEGLLEDFFGAWVSDEESPENKIYDPDDDWSLLLSLP